MTTLLAWMPGPLEWIVILIVAVILFGRRLPEVARSAGKSIVEFKKGLRDTQEEMDRADKKLPRKDEAVETKVAEDKP